MLKKQPSSSQAQKSQASTGPNSTTHTAFPRPHSLYSLRSRRDFDLSVEHNTKYIWQFCKYNAFRMDIQVSEQSASFSFQLSLKYGLIK